MRHLMDHLWNKKSRLIKLNVVSCKTFNQKQINMNIKITEHQAYFPDPYFFIEFKIKYLCIKPTEILK